MKIILAALPFLLFSFACTSDPGSSELAERASEPPAVEAFFNLDGYMTGEIERLTEQKVTANKSITLNGVIEEQTGIMINYANDLRLFREADINKPAWVEKYAAAEEKLSGSHATTTYTARDSNLVVQRLFIEEDQGVPVKIEIDRKTGTVLSDGQHQLIYEPGSGYSVRTQQANRFGKDVEAVIEVKWVR